MLQLKTLQNPTREMTDQVFRVVEWSLQRVEDNAFHLRLDRIGLSSHGFHTTCAPACGKCFGSAMTRNNPL